jgi:hypothetical protein
LFVRVKDRPRLLPLDFALFLCMSHLVEIGWLGWLPHFQIMILGSAAEFEVQLVMGLM